ncbi:hypothetical protein H2199_000827 [Coniosporium tulheliwenetii]|uniref:Uncharacterized protein n=1 Tax=Coniosporium tulheliwenetii TaxID=3383036 RepID=A0ACC2ZN23_9PEZI|nr:hypothetical protein H2199_000827 [Cladosporium sp. JES 115]
MVGTGVPTDRQPEKEAVPLPQSEVQKPGQTVQDLSRYPISLRSKANAAIQPKQDVPAKKAKGCTAKTQVGTLQPTSEAEAMRVEELMRAAGTDAELWNVLETEVFSAIRQLELDGPRPSETKHTKSSPNQQPSPGLAAIGPNYPSFLLMAVRQFRQEFPSSTLALAVLPEVKALGRSSYALGASTPLYNELITIAWLNYADFHEIDYLLHDMDRGGIEFDGNTLDLIASILVEQQKARRGWLGGAVAAVWEMESLRRGFRKLERWRDVVQARLEADAVRQAHEKDAPEEDGEYSII